MHQSPCCISLLLLPLLKDTDYCRPETPHNSCSFGYALIQPYSHHNLALGKLTQILMRAPISFFQHIDFENKMFICCLIQCIQPTNRCHDEWTISVIHFTYHYIYVGGL
ncbi:hypothetical protein AMECASPLE_002075 [Ameca splendens]|uniref:Secreted protein n=1 Tax=Ameca splendens TaxID=208324 RepID=A0ABV0XY01_9TELE